MSVNTLPIILVSAGDRADATKFIEDLTKDQMVELEDCSEGSKVWTIINKYYHARVHMKPMEDGQQLPEAWEHLIEAHIIYISETEVKRALAAKAAETRRERATRASVRLVVTPSAGGGTLRAWAQRHRYELVSLREAPGDDEPPAGPFAETYGLDRVRAALHAQAWRGHRRVDGAAPPHRPAEGGGDADSSEGESSDGEAAVERAERFAAALGSLGALGGAGLAQLPTAERRAAAERLVAEFCRALGADLPAL